MAVHEISDLYISTFADNVIHLAQQKKSKLRDTVTVKSGVGNQHRFQTVAARSTMTKRTAQGTNAGKRPATAYADTVYGNRVVLPSPYTTADSYEWEDVARMIVDPQSALTTSMAAQLGRTYDDVIIASLFAAALDDLGNSHAHLAAQQLGGATTAPSFDLINLARETLEETDIDLDEEKFMLVSPNFVSALLADEKATSFDFNNAKALASGQVVQGWMGFTWKVTNRLTTPGGTPKQIYGAAYTKDAIGLVVNTEGKVDIGKDPGQSFTTTVQLACDIGAVRIQDAKCLRIHYLETN
jgi:hypothetical protein